MSLLSAVTDFNWNSIGTGVDNLISGLSGFASDTKTSPQNNQQTAFSQTPVSDSTIAKMNANDTTQQNTMLYYVIGGVALAGLMMFLFHKK